MTDTDRLIFRMDVSRAIAGMADNTHRAVARLSLAGRTDREISTRIGRSVSSVGRIRRLAVSEIRERLSCYAGGENE